MAEACLTDAPRQPCIWKFLVVFLGADWLQQGWGGGDGVHVRRKEVCDALRRMMTTRGIRGFLLPIKVSIFIVIAIIAV